MVSSNDLVVISWVAAICMRFWLMGGCMCDLRTFWMQMTWTRISGSRFCNTKFFTVHLIGKVCFVPWLLRRRVLLECCRPLNSLWLHFLHSSIKEENNIRWCWFPGASRQPRWVALSRDLAANRSSLQHLLFVLVLRSYHLTPIPSSRLSDFSASHCQ